MEKNKYNFQKLTPINDADLETYKEAFDYALTDNDIKNIAVSGPYGSGKSSIIETFKKKCDDLKYLHISLAYFQPTEKDVRESEIKNNKQIDKDHSSLSNQAILEGKILNQLIHQSNPKKIPQSDFKLKEKVSRRNIIVMTILTVLFVVLLSYLISFDLWSEFVYSFSNNPLKAKLMFTTYDGFRLICGFIFILIFSLAIYKTLKIQKNKNLFKKLKLQGNEIELFEKNSDSFFDKYLNEVLYLFDNADADVIFFEDIDRYETNYIFAKLREINTLINNKRTKEQKKILRFFYLVKDDIFDSKDRTKFFDFIIPIVPVIDGSNSYDKFIEYFEEGGILKLFDENFLHKLSLYVDDMRLLKNIYNEFVIYNKRLNNINLDSNKLLSIITYKNIFPKDFNDLQLGRGFVYTLFNNKDRFLKEELDEINEKINELEEKIYKTEIEKLQSVDELDALYLVPHMNIIRIDQDTKLNYDTRAEIVRAMKESSEDVIGRVKNTNYSIGVNEELEELLENPKYKDRLQTIERRINGQLERLKEELKDLDDRKIILQNRKLKDIITKDNINEMFTLPYLNEKNKYKEIQYSLYSPLIKYLLREGYLGEDYADFMTYFYDHSLSINVSVK